MIKFIMLTDNIIFEMDGKVALVTGSTGGIGLEIAKELLRNGCKVIMTGSRTKDAASSAIQEASAHGKIVHYVQCNLHTEIDTLCAEVDKLYPNGVDILVNNAGITYIHSIDGYTLEKWDEMISVNLTAPFRLTRHVLPNMREKKWGRIINISSVLGVTGAQHKAVYTATKHGLNGLTKGTALDVATEGITVNAICPGYVDTPMLTQVMEPIAREKNITIEEAKKDLVKGTHPNEKLVDPLQIAKLVDFLCSWGGASITGAVFMMDGGYIAR